MPVIAPGLQGHSRVTRRSYKNAICAQKPPKEVSICFHCGDVNVIRKRKIQFTCMHTLIRKRWPHFCSDSHQETSASLRPALYHDLPADQQCIQMRCTVARSVLTSRAH